MTIQILGHVEKAELENAPPGRVAVLVRFGSADALPVTVFVPLSDAGNWSVGSNVHLTAFAVSRAKVDPPAPPPPPADSARAEGGGRER